MKNLLETLNIRPVDNTAKEGKLIEIFRGSHEFDRIGGLKQVTAHFFAPYQPGGNHFHKTKYEIMYILNGEVEVFLRESDDDKIYNEKISEGKKFDLIPTIAHALHSSNGATIIEFTNLAFNPDNPRNDVYPCEVFSLEKELVSV